MIIVVVCVVFVVMSPDTYQYNQDGTSRRKIEYKPFWQKQYDMD
jgi:hypothetical protein